MTSHWPERWQPTRLKYESSLKGRLGWQGLKADEYRDEGPHVVSSAHFERERIRWELCPRVSMERYLLDENIQLAERDILLMKDGAALGKLAYVDRLPGPSCLNSHLLLLRPIRSSYDQRYMFHLTTTDVFQDYMQVYGTGATFMGVSQRDIGNFPFFLPPLDEQTQIAKFLDYETAKIDQLIDKQQQLIALLKEKRHAVISHAVTKGLNPDAPMKDSGVEWLGQVPAHWNDLPLKALFSLKHGFAFDGAAFSDTGAHMLMTPGNFVEQGGFRPKMPEKFYARRDFPPEFILNQGQLLVAMTEQAPGLLGCALIVPGGGTYLHNQRLGLVCELDLERLDERFLFHLFNSPRYRAEVSISATGVKVRHTSPSKMLSIKIWLPPLSEQQAIAKYVDAQTTTIDATQDKALLAVSLLQERRTALISAAVTGKIDVRNWKPPEGEAIQEVA